MNQRCPYQAIQLGHRGLAARLANVPDFDTAFATSVDMARGVAYGNGAHHLAVAQCVYLTGVAWNAGANQSVGWEGHRLHLTICTDMKGVRPKRIGGGLLVFYISAFFFMSNAVGETLTVCRQKWM